MVVYAKISTSRTDIYFAGRSLENIREDLLQFDYEFSELVEVTEKEASQMPYFQEGKLVILINNDKCFHIGSTYEKQKIDLMRCVEKNPYLFWSANEN